MDIFSIAKYNKITKQLQNFDSKLNAAGVFSFNASSQVTDVTADFQNMITNAREGEIINPSGDGVISSISVTNKRGITIAPKGNLKLNGPMTFTGCHSIKLSGGFVGNKSVITSVASIDTTLKTITFSDYTYFTPGSEFVVVGLTPFAWFKMRGSVVQINNGVILYSPITTIGGSDLLVSPGDEVRLIITSDQSVRGSIYINDSDYVTVDGYFERDLILHNCRHSTMRFRGKYGQPSVEFCSDVHLEIDTQDSPFYGFASFKNRRLSGYIKSQKANFGNLVTKATYDSHFTSVYGEYGLVYGWQVRDDIGTANPSTVNPDLQTNIVESKGVSVGSVKLLRCGRGLFLDGISRQFSAGAVEVNETAGQGASVHIASNGAFDVDLPRVIISDHGAALSQIGYFRSNAPIRIEQGNDISIKASIYGSLHTGYSFTANASAGVVDRYKLDITLDNCLAGVDISGNATDVEIVARGRNPAADGTISLVNITGPGDLIKVKQAILETPTNGKKWQNGIAIISTSTVGFSGRAFIEGVDARSGSVLNADIYVEPGNTSTPANSGEVHIRRSSLLGGGLYGVSLRWVDKAYVYDNDISGHTTSDYHTLNFSASDYRIETRERQYSFTIDWPSIALGGSSRSSVLNVSGWTSDSVATGCQYKGNSKGLQFQVYHANTGQIYVTATNPAANPEGAVDLASGQMRLCYKTVYRPY